MTIVILAFRWNSAWLNSGFLFLLTLLLEERKLDWLWTWQWYKKIPLIPVLVVSIFLNIWSQILRQYFLNAYVLNAYTLHCKVINAIVNHIYIYRAIRSVSLSSMFSMPAFIVNFLNSFPELITWFVPSRHHHHNHHNDRHHHR